MGFVEEVPDSKLPAPRRAGAEHRLRVPRVADADRARAAGPRAPARPHERVVASCDPRPRARSCTCPASRPAPGFLSNMNVGTRLPAYATPMGWLLLVRPLGARARERCIRRARSSPLTDQTPRNVGELAQRIATAVSGRPRDQPRRGGAGRQLDRGAGARPRRPRGRGDRHLGAGFGVRAWRVRNARRARSDGHRGAISARLGYRASRAPARRESRAARASLTPDRGQRRAPGSNSGSAGSRPRMRSATSGPMHGPIV